jgi:hypothetical protein
MSRHRPRHSEWVTNVLAAAADDPAEVDRILAGPPSGLAFRGLCAAVRDTDLVTRGEERLAEWPGEVRAVPWSWLAALEAGHPRPACRLVRSLNLRTPHAKAVSDVLLDYLATKSPRDWHSARGHAS